MNYKKFKTPYTQVHVGFRKGQIEKLDKISVKQKKGRATIIKDAVYKEYPQVREE